MPLSSSPLTGCALVLQDIVCVEVDGHQYVPVVLLGCEGECSGLVDVDGVSEVVNAEESLVGFGDRCLVER